MRKSGFGTIQAFRMITLMLLGGIIVLIGLNFFLHSKDKTRIPSIIRRIEQQKVEEQNAIEHLEAKGQKENHKIRADKHYIGEDGFYHCEGNVEIILFKRSDNEDVFLYGDEIKYDRDFKQFYIPGKSVIRFKGLTIEAFELEYDASKEVFKSDKGVDFTSERLSGSARIAFYRMKKNQLRMQKNVHLEIFPKLETSFPLTAEGNVFDYDRRRGTGKMEGGISLFHGKSYAEADFLRFELLKDQEQFKLVQLRKDVNIILMPEENRGEEEKASGSVILYDNRREIQADTVNIKGFKDLSKVRDIEAEGNCSFRFISSTGSSNRINARRVRYVLNRVGELHEFGAVGNAKLIQKETGGAGERVIQGESFSVSGNKAALEVRGKTGVKTTVIDQEYQLAADEIDLSLKAKNLEARGNVEIIFAPRSEEEEAVGFFTKDQSVFIIAQELRYSEESKRFVFKGKVKIWQGKQLLLTEELMFFKDTGRITCSGKMRTFITYQPKDLDKEEIAEISGGKLRFEPEKNFLVYEEGCQLKLKNVDLKAQDVTIHLDPAQGGMKGFVAREDVVIVQDQYEGRGDVARYDLDKETVELTGNPKLFDKDKGESEGDKLTFHLADGRIIVENKERKRSETVIKK